VEDSSQLPTSHTFVAHKPHHSQLTRHVVKEAAAYVRFSTRVSTREAQHASQWGVQEAARVAAWAHLNTDQQTAVCEGLVLSPHLPSNLRRLEWSARLEELESRLSTKQQRKQQSDAAIAQLIANQHPGISDAEASQHAASHDDDLLETHFAEGHQHQFQHRAAKRRKRQQRTQQIAALRRAIEQHRRIQPGPPQLPAMQSQLWSQSLQLALQQLTDAASAASSARSMLTEAASTLDQARQLQISQRQPDSLLIAARPLLHRACVDAAFAFKWSADAGRSATTDLTAEGCLTLGDREQEHDLDAYHRMTDSTADELGEDLDQVGCLSTGVGGWGMGAEC